MNPRASVLVLALIRAGLVGHPFLSLSEPDAEALRQCLPVCRVVHRKTRRYWILVPWFGREEWLATEGDPEDLFQVRFAPPPAPQATDARPDGSKTLFDCHHGIPTGVLAVVCVDDYDYSAEGRVIYPRDFDLPPPLYPRHTRARIGSEGSWRKAVKLNLQKSAYRPWRAAMKTRSL